MIPLPTIQLPPLTWTGFCAGAMVATVVVLAYGIWLARKKSEEEIVGIPFKDIPGLYKPDSKERSN